MTDPTYHPVATQILALLEKNHCWFETFTHAPVRTSEEAAAVRPGYTLQQGAKAIIVRVKLARAEKKFVMLVLPGDSRFDTRQVKALLQAQDVRFATEAEVQERTGGVQLGGVPPFGNLFDLAVIADPSLLQHEKIVFNAGDRRFSIGMRAADYTSLVQPRVAPIVEK